MATRVRSYSKINLGLAIGPVRADGFHALSTLYQTLALHDHVTVEAKPRSQNRDLGHPESCGSKITLTTNHPQVPTDARNTAWKIVELALARMGIAAQVAVHIEKALPVQGGLGAGSANAAAALIALERELGLALPQPARLEIAAQVGSDVPLFLLGGAVLGTGRGEQVAPMPDLPATWCVVAVPEIGVSTPRAFRDWDERQGTGNREQGTECREQEDSPPSQSRTLAHSPSPLQTKDVGPAHTPPLTSPAQPDRLRELSHAYASVLGVLPSTEDLQPVPASDTSGIVRGLAPGRNQDGLVETPEPGDTRNDLAGNPLLALVRTGIENDFESVVFPQYPLLREIKHELMGTSAGSSDVAIARDLSSIDQPAGGNAFYAALSGSGSTLFGLYRSRADAVAAQQRVQASGCTALLTWTLPRQEYWRTMFAE